MDAASLCDRLINRIEDLAASNSRLASAKQRLTAELNFLRGTLSAAQEGNRRRDRDMRAAEAKIEEWRAYAADLRDRVNWKRQTDVPVLPKSLEFELPF